MNLWTGPAECSEEHCRSEAEVLSWVSMLNIVAASFSSRALPPAVDSRGGLTWPRLPRAPSKAGLDDQVRTPFLLNVSVHISKFGNNS